MKKVFIIIGFIGAFLYCANSQEFMCEGYTEDSPSEGGPRGAACSQSSSAYLNSFRYQYSWYPTGNVPQKYINIAFTVRQTSDPNNPGNFSQNNPAHLQYLDSIILKMNGFLSNIPLPSDPRTLVHYTDSRI